MPLQGTDFFFPFPQGDALGCHVWPFQGLDLFAMRQRGSICPWQNGRIERLFRTLKERLYPWWQSVGVPDDVQVDLDVFKTWYNHARPHQSLASLTPAMAWAARTGHRKCPRFFLAWDGLLTGWIPPP